MQQKNNVVTFDLAIAKPNMQLQVEESPIYDKLFINIGVFYVEIGFFQYLENTINSLVDPIF